MNFLMIKVYFQISEFESSIFWQFDNFIVKLRKNVLTENWARKIGAVSIQKCYIGHPMDNLKAK